MARGGTGSMVAIDIELWVADTVLLPQADTLIFHKYIYDISCFPLNIEDFKV